MLNLNIEKMMKNKNKSVQILTKGVEFLFKKNKVTYLKGKGVIFSPTSVVVYDQGKKTSYNTKNIVIATGSSTSLPQVKIDEKNIISSTAALSLNSVPKSLVGYRWRLYWIRNGFSLEKIRSRSDSN